MFVLARLVKAKSYLSKDLGRLTEGQCVIVPTWAQSALPPFFEFSPTEEIRDWPLRFEGGLGDKIYAIPALYDYQGRIGVGQRDRPLFRVVESRVRHVGRNDLNVLGGLGHENAGELVDQIAKRLAVEPKMKLPLLQTIPSEKQTVLSRPPYVVVVPHASTKDRSFPKLVELRKEIKDREVEVLGTAGWHNAALIERADCVISVNTSAIPMAGALQVPIVAVGVRKRVGYFLEAIEVGKSVEEALAGYEEMMRRPRITCWCGETDGRRSVKENIHIIECKECSTERQDVKVSKVGLDRYYEETYQDWRKVLDHERKYTQRKDHDREIAKMRMRQWESILKEVPENAAWLDVGSGSGALVDILRAKGYQAVGIEPAEEFENGYPHTTWETSGQYDVISYVDVLEHTIAHVEIKRALPHLKAKGKMVIEIPIASEEPKHYRRLQHLYFFTEETMAACASAHGLRVARKGKPRKGRVWMQLERK